MGVCRERVRTVSLIGGGVTVRYLLLMDRAYDFEWFWSAIDLLVGMVHG